MTLKTEDQKHQLPELILDKLAAKVRVIVSYLETSHIGKLALSIFKRQEKCKEKKIFLELAFPAETSKSAYATEQLYKLLGTLSSSGETNREAFALEIVSTKDKGIRYLAILPTPQAEIFKKGLRTFLPGIKIAETGDYMDEASGEWTIAEFGQRGHFVMPLTRQKTLSEHDPIGYLTGNMTQLAAGELMALQIVAMPISRFNNKTALVEIDELREKIKRGEPLGEVVQRENNSPLAATPSGRTILFFFRSMTAGLIGCLRGVEDILRMVIGKATPTVDPQQSKQEVNNVYENEIEALVKEKLDKPLFSCSVRLLVKSQNHESRESRVAGVVAALGQFGNLYQGLTMREKTAREEGVKAARALSKYIERLVNNEAVSGLSLILSSEELSDIYHLPYTETTKTEDLVKVLSCERPAPLSLKTDTKLEVVFGVNRYGGQETLIGLSAEDRLRHVYILGQTGSGKSTVLFQMAKGDIASGRGVAVVDPHGDLVDDLLSCIPQERENDLVYINPVDLEYPVGINLLELPEDLVGDELELEKELACEGAVSVLRRIFQKEGEKDAHRIEYVLRNAIHTAFTVPGRTIFTVYELLNDPDFRRSVTKNLKDPNLKNFWKHEFGRAGHFQMVKMTAGVTAKVGRFLFSPSARRILGAERSTIDFGEIFEKGKIVLCRVPEGELGEDTAEMIGTVILTKIYQAAQRRVRMGRESRRPFYLYVDEFQNFASTAFTRMLSAGRKFGLGITMAEQSTAQQANGDIVEVILANVGTVICFRTAGPADEILMERQFSPVIKRGEIGNLPRYHFYIRLGAREPEEPFSGETVKPEMTRDESLRARLIEASQRNYTAKKSELQTAGEPGEPNGQARLISEQQVEKPDEGS